MIITVYTYDPTTNIPTGMSIAQESPLEPGVILFPPNCTEIQPPPFDSATHECKWNGSAWDVTPIPVEPQLPPTTKELKAIFISSVQDHIDHVANLKGYDSGVSCASYAADTHPPFAADAAAFIPWRSNVWLYCYAEWAKLEAGQRTMTTAESFISELPAAPW